MITEFRDFFDGVVVRASHIVISLPPTATPQEVTEAQQKLTAMRAQLLAGQADFAALAKEHSHCPSAKEGGDIGYFPRKGAVDELWRLLRKDTKE